MIVTKRGARGAAVSIGAERLIHPGFVVDAIDTTGCGDTFGGVFCSALFHGASVVDALAVAIGTSHGAYKFTRKPDGEVLAMARIEEIHRRLPNCHLVMHGSSSVPQELQDMINRYGGKMPQTWGVPVEEIQRGIKHGVRKINVDTDNRMAITAAIRKVLWEYPDKFDPRDYLKPARDAMKKICAERMVQFGQAGNARKIPIVTLAEMAQRYTQS